MSGAQLMWDALADAEREVADSTAENAALKQELVKTYRLLVKAFCDCRKTTLVLPIDPTKHTLTCKYRRSLNDER